jgi:glycosyltransferase involved in cell wall biosynthesis
VKPKVSVATIAYNHVGLIRQSVESSLNQKVDFPFEIVIGEDCSTDGTREVVQQLADEHPGVIRPLLGESNIGMQRNFSRTLEACQGEYIAVLDSDDYWTSNEKLAKQVKFMDENPDHVLSFHRIHIVKEQSPEKNVHTPVEKAVSDVEDLVFNNYLSSCSTMYRRDRIPPIPAWFAEVYPYDWALATLMLIPGGTIGFIDEEMAVYRVHSSNMFSRLDERTKLEKEIGYYDKIIDLLPERAVARAKFGKADRLYDLANNYRHSGDRDTAKIKFAEALMLETERYKLPWRRKVRMKLRLALGL